MFQKWQYQIFLFQINAVHLNFLFIKEYWKKKIISFHKKYLSSTNVFDIDNNKKAVNQQITMISEGSCDTEDWRNNAENSA